MTSSLLAQQIQDYARRPQKVVTLREVIDTAHNATPETALANANMLYTELPIRLARRSRELDNLPYGLGRTEHVMKVKGWYAKSFQQLVSSKRPATMEDLQAFTQMLMEILQRHANVVPTMAQGVLQIKNQVAGIEDCPYLQDFLDRFFLSRIGIRVMISHQIAMMDKLQNKSIEDREGILHNHNPTEIIRAAIVDATRTCERNYGVAPHVELKGSGGDMDIKLVPSHLHHMLHEVLKNSMRATVEHHGVNCEELPAIEIITADGEEDWSLKVSDRGGGIEFSRIEKVWSYLYTTAPRPGADFFEGNLSSAPMAGLGYGLPLSRLFAQYLGGDLELVSVEGFGTDVCLYLNKLHDIPLALD